MIVDTDYQREVLAWKTTVTPTSSPELLERLLDLTWPGIRRARLGEWVLRAGNNHSGRANSVLACGDPGVPFAEAERLAEAWAGRRMQLQVVAGSQEQRLAEAEGYVSHNPTVVMVADARISRGPESTAASAPDAGWRRTPFWPSPRLLRRAISGWVTMPSDGWRLLTAGVCSPASRCALRPVDADWDEPSRGRS